MAQLVSIEQAAANSLASYLATQLPNVTVSPRWPTPSKEMPAKAVTVVPVGRRQEVDHLGDFIRVVAIDRAFLFDDTGQPLVDDDGNQLEDTAHKVYTFAVNPIEQPIQLDVWAQNDFDRDDIVARLDNALSQGLVTTGIAANADPFRDGPLLALSDGYAGNVDFTFDGPDKIDNPDAASRSERRATYAGTARCTRTQQVLLPTLTTVRLKLRIGEVIPTDTMTYRILTSGDLSWSIP